MKGFLITLLAFPAVLAVPAPTTTSDDWPTQFPIDTFKCRCSDGVSKTTIGSCLYFGQGIGPEGDDWVCASYYSVLIFILINYSKLVLSGSLI